MKRFLGLSSFLVAISLVPTITYSQWGAQFGITYNIQNGNFIAPCGCTFANGNGIGYHFAISYDLISVAGLAIGIQPGVEFQNFTAFEVDPTRLVRLANGDTQEVGLEYFTFGPYIRYTIPFMSLFVQLTPEFQYQIGSTYHHIPTLAGLNPDTSLDVRSQRYAAAVSAGYRFHLGIVDIAPMLTADYPLSVLRSTQASDWRVTVVTASLAVFF